MKHLDMTTVYLSATLLLSVIVKIAHESAIYDMFLDFQFLLHVLVNDN